MDESDKVRLLRRRVKVRARYAFAIEVIVAEAARRLEVRDDLREE